MDKKELKKQYKQNVRPMGIFQIKNLTNGKIFIGSAKDLNGKINSIKFQLEMNSNMNSELQQDFNKYGEKNFLFETMDLLDPKEDPNYDYTEDLNVLEEMWLEKLQPFDDKGYNKKKKR
jgi:group I intron endonuclease